MYALFEKGNATFSEGKLPIFSDIDALAVSMSEKLLRSFSRKATVLFLKGRYYYELTWQSNG